MQRLTKEQAALIGCYTGFSFGPFKDVHELAEKTLSRPIFTHEFASDKLWEQLREALRPRLSELCIIGEAEAAKGETK